jgi:hypothetical protein
MSTQSNLSSNQNLSSWFERNPTPEDIEKAVAYGYSFDLRTNLSVLSDDPTDLNPYLIGVSIESNYEKAVFPVVRVVLSLPKAIAFAIQDDYRNLEFFLTIERQVSGDPSSSEVSKKEVVIKKKVFRTIAPSSVEYSEDKDDSDPGSENRLKSDMPLLLVLFEEECLGSRKDLHNDVFKNSTVGEVINILLGRTFKNKIVTVVKPDNTSVYENIFIPPMDLPSALEYLQRFYGIYERGIQFFFGTDNVYISPRGKCSVAPVGFYSNTLMRVFNKGQAGADAVYGLKSTFKDEENGLYVAFFPSPPSVMINDSSIKEIIGKDLIVASDSGQRITELGGGIEDNSTAKTRYIWTGSSSKYAADDIAFSVNQCVEYVLGVIPNTDITLFFPLMNVTLRYTYKINIEVSGNYRFGNILHTFVRISDSDALKSPLFSVNTTVRLSRV